MEEPLDLVCDVMLAHLRQLCQANVDYAALKALIAGLPPTPGLAFTS